MKSEVMTITPEMAIRYLKTNIENNRRINRDRVGRYAQDMLNGKWMLTHQGIAFDEQGKLIDGQHRLRAIVRAGIPVKMMVSTGVKCDGNSLLMIDVGQPRNYEQILNISGVTDDVISSAMPVVRLFAKYKFGDITISMATIIDYVEKHKEDLEFVLVEFRRIKGDTKQKVCTSKRMPAIVCAAAYSALCAGESKNDIHRFARVYAFNETEGCSGYGYSAKLCLDGKDRFSKMIHNQAAYDYMENLIRCFCSGKERMRMKSGKCYEVSPEYRPK